LECFGDFNSSVFDKLLPRDDEVKIYQDLVSALLILEPQVKNEEAKASFPSILNTMKFLVLKIDNLLAEKTKSKDEISHLVEQVEKLTKRLDSVLKPDDVDADVEASIKSVNEGNVVNVKSSGEDMPSGLSLCYGKFRQQKLAKMQAMSDFHKQEGEKETFFSPVYSTRDSVQQLLQSRGYNAASVGINICKKPFLDVSLSISVDSIEVLDQSTKDKISLITKESGCFLTLNDGKQLRRFRMKEAASTKEAGNACSSSSRSSITEVSSESTWNNVSFWSHQSSGSVILGGTMALMLCWFSDPVGTVAVDPEEYSNTVAVMTAAHVISRTFKDCREVPQFRLYGTKTFCDIAFIDIGDKIPYEVMTRFNSVDFFDGQDTHTVCITDTISTGLQSYYHPRTEPFSVNDITKYILLEMDVEVYLNGRLNQSKGRITSIYEDLGCFIIEIEMAVGKVEVGDSGALIFTAKAGQAEGVAVAVLKGISEDGANVAFATLLTELLPYFVVPPLNGSDQGDV